MLLVIHGPLAGPASHHVDRLLADLDTAGIPWIRTPAEPWSVVRPALQAAVVILAAGLAEAVGTAAPFSPTYREYHELVGPLALPFVPVRAGPGAAPDDLAHADAYDLRGPPSERPALFATLRSLLHPTGRPS